MNSLKWTMTFIVGLAIAVVPATATATTILIDDTAPDGTVTLKRDGVVIAPDTSLGEQLNIWDSLQIANVNPAQTVSGIVFLTEPSPSDSPGTPPLSVSDSIRLTLSPNGDGTSSLLLAFQSDSEDRPILNSAPPEDNETTVREELPGGNQIGSIAKFPSLTGGSQTFANLDITVKSDVIPEPATLLLLGSALAGLALWRRRPGMCSEL